MSQATEMQGFLPDDYAETKTQRRTNVLWAAIFLIVAAGIGSAFFIAEKKIKQAEDDNKAALDRFAAAAGPIEQLARMQEEHQRLNKQAELANSLVEKVNRTNILAEVTNTRPKDVALVDFSLDGKPRLDGGAAYARATAARTGKPALPEPITFDVNMHMKGIALNDELVAQYMTNLKKSPLFRDVFFVVTRELAFKDQKLREFEFDLVLDPAADVRQPAADAAAPPASASR